MVEAISPKFGTMPNPLLAPTPIKWWWVCGGGWVVVVVRGKTSFEGKVGRERRGRRRGEDSNSRGRLFECLLVVLLVDEETTKMIHEVFNLIKQDSMTPNSWTKVMVVVIYRKGARQTPKLKTNLFFTNFFSIMIYDRLCAKIDSYQFPDQAGFRNNFQTTDQLMKYRLTAQNRMEMGIDMWVAVIDFQEAFDSTQHDANQEISQKPHYQ